MDELRSTIDKPTNEIRRDLKREYGVSLNYQQAYMVKEKALAHIHGHPKESYMLIPWICDRISGRVRPIIYVDGCHLSGLYKGTLLGAQAYDANNELFPLAYAIVGGETFDDWAWFLQNIKDITRSLELTIISNRHNAIIGAIQAIFGSDQHGYCYRHLKENYSAEFLKLTTGKRKTKEQTKEAALKYLDAIAYARRGNEFNTAMANLELFNNDLAQWLKTKGDIDRWAQSKFPYKHWDNITTNIAESFNAWLLKERKHNIAVLIHEHRDKLARKMHKSKLAMST